MADTNVKIIDDWLVDRMCLIIDNDQPLWRKVTNAAMQAVCDHIPGDDDGSDYANAVGTAVAEEIKTWLDDTPAGRILSDVLALDGWHIQSLLGQHYLPTEL